MLVGEVRNFVFFVLSFSPFFGFFFSSRSLSLSLSLSPPKLTLSSPPVSFSPPPSLPLHTQNARRGLPMPHKQEILTVVGDPIDVVQCDAPTQEQVDAVHAKLCASLCEMFESHKGKLGPEWAEKRMVIV